MKRYITILILAVVIQSCSTSESIFELGPQQSMSITGKGEGQDAAYNPYSNTRSIAIVKSLSDNPFTIRIQSKGELIEKFEVSKKSKKEVVLEKGYELYFDSDLASKAQVKFKSY